MVATVKILNVPLSAINMSEAVSTILAWTTNGDANFVCVRDVHGLMQSVNDPEMMSIQNAAGLVTPDGMPLVWLARLRGFSNVRRVCGFDLVDAVCAASEGKNVSHF